MRTLLALLILTGLFSSCSKSPKCWGDNKNKGIINNAIRIDCAPSGEQFIISDDTTYINTFSSGCDLPPIDFNTHSLLGLYTEGDCKLKFIREVSQVDNENKYHYKVTAKSCGSCEKLAFSYNWVTVPKLPNGGTVTFEIVEK